MKLEQSDALIVVDVQRDFYPGGGLAVPGGDQVVPALRRYIELFEGRNLPVVYTRDWHPPGHCSFQEEGGPWPVHCLADSKGAEFHPDLPIIKGAVIISKAITKEREAYSGFQGTGLEEMLRRRGVERILVGGLATDYCVKQTSLDGLKAGFAVVILLDSVRAVDVKPGDGARALEDLTRSGSQTIRFGDLNF